jgi:hypothetical protein
MQKITKVVPFTVLTCVFLNIKTRENKNSDTAWLQCIFQLFALQGPV